MIRRYREMASEAKIALWVIVAFLVYAMLLGVVERQLIPLWW